LFTHPRLAFSGVGNDITREFLDGLERNPIIQQGIYIPITPGIRAKELGHIKEVEN